MELPGLRRTRLHNLAKYQESEKEGNSGRKDEKLRKRKGDRGREKKWEHCEAFAKLAFDKSSFWRGGGPTTTEPFETRILVDKPPYGHPTAHPACAKSIVTIDDHLVRRTRACASIYPFLRWRLWRFQNKPIQALLSRARSDVNLQFANFYRRESN